MEIGNGWLFPTTPMATILKARPLSMELFENFGINLWNFLHVGIGKACAASGIAWEVFAAALNNLKRPVADSDWKSLPIYHLLDFLTADHREFRSKFIPSIGRTLSEDVLGDPESLMRLRVFVLEWPGFVSSLVEHMREEEEILFLRILRYEYGHRLGSIDPNFEGGSVQAFKSIRMLNDEHRDLKLIREFFDNIYPIYSGSLSRSCVLEAVLGPLLDRFHVKLVAHARLEMDILFPMAIALEKSLYDRFTQGGLRI